MVAKFGSNSFHIINAGTITSQGVIVEDHSDFDFWSGEFTIEMWLYRDSATYKNYALYCSFIQVYTEAGANNLYFSYNNSWFLTLNSQGFTTPVSIGTIPLNTWKLLTIQRKSGIYEVFLDGVFVYHSGVYNSSYVNYGQGNYGYQPMGNVYLNGYLYIGRKDIRSAETWSGYIDEVSITKGIAKYGEPVFKHSPFPDNIAGDPFFNEVLLLLHGNGVNGEQVFTDSSSYARTPTIVGNIITSTTNATYFYGGSSISCSVGAASYIEYTNPGGFLASDTSPFTLEFKVFYTGSSGTSEQFQEYVPGKNTLLYLTSNGSKVFEFGNTVLANWEYIILIYSGMEFYVQTRSDWIYLKTFNIVISRGTDLETRLYVNGDYITKLTTTPYAYNFDSIKIGNPALTANTSQAQYEEIRLTAACRYPLASFTPNDLPYCDAVSDGSELPDPIDGFSPLHGVASVTQTGNVGLVDRSVQLTGSWLYLTSTPPTAGLSDVTQRLYGTAVGTVLQGSLQAYNVSNAVAALTGTTIQTTGNSISTNIPFYPSLFELFDIDLGLVLTGTTVYIRYMSSGYIYVDIGGTGWNFNNPWMLSNSNYQVYQIAHLYELDSRITMYEGDPSLVTISGGPTLDQQPIINCGPRTTSGKITFGLVVKPTAYNPRYGIEDPSNPSWSPPFANHSFTIRYTTPPSNVVQTWAFTEFGDQKLAPQNTYASILFRNDGQITFVGNQSPVGPLVWYSPPTAGAGDNYWIKITKTSGANWDAGLVSGTLYKMDVNRGLSWTITYNGVTKDTYMRVDIYADAGGTVLVSSNNIRQYSETIM